MANAASEDWRKTRTGSAVQISGRLTGADADTVRRMALFREGPLDVVKRIIGLFVDQREKLEAAEKRVIELDARLSEATAVIREMATGCLSLSKSYKAMADHVDNMNKAQTDTAEAADTVARECVAIRDSVSGALSSLEESLIPQITSVVQSAEFINAVIDHLCASTPGMPRSADFAEQG